MRYKRTVTFENVVTQLRCFDEFSIQKDGFLLELNVQTNQHGIMRRKSMQKAMESYEA